MPKVDAIGKRYTGLDIAKLLLSFLILYIHAPLPGIGQYAVYLSRIAVPIFLMISGYFDAQMSEERKKGR